MPYLILYCIKASAALALMYLFYQLVLRKLTFYQWNRWYLAGYSMLAFVIPFMDITDFLQRNELQQSGLVQLIPVIKYQRTGTAGEQSVDAGSIWLIIFFTGTALMLVRTTIQFLSLYRLRLKAQLLHSDKVNLYHVNENVIPFSFHNSIYLNKHLHNENELQEIIRHEFVHVKQKHSLDILLGEILCIVLWFNPFAWLMRHAIRQNLEFLADDQVLQNGLDKKQYQYLLLKVIGNRQFSVAANFNFSSLKNRIAMMNKLKSAKLHLIKFLFILPLLAVLLVSFRDKIHYKQDHAAGNKTVDIAGVVVDAESYAPIAGATVTAGDRNITAVTDERGYYKIQLPVVKGPLSFKIEVKAADYRIIRSTENWGDFSQSYIYDTYGKTIEVFGLSKQGAADKSFSSIAGNSKFDEGLAYENVAVALEEVKKQQTDPNYRTRDTVPDHQLPANIREIRVTKYNGVNKVVIILKNGNIESYDLNDAKQSEAFEKKYGFHILPPPPPPPSASTVPEMPKDVASIHITKNNGENKILVERKDGKKEAYNLNDPNQKAAFEKKYGKIKEPVPVPVTEEVSVDVPSATVAPAPIASITIAPSSPLSAEIMEVAVAPLQPVALNSKGYYLSIADNQGECVVIVKDKNKKIVEAVKLTDWNANEQQYEKKYGKLPPAPPPSPVPAVNGTVGVSVMEDEVLPGGNYKVYGTVAPLYVVDGKVIERGNINSIDPDTIEHINILKGTSTTTLYGEKGANGVVEVKTKNTTITGKAASKLNSTTKGLTGSLPSGALYFIDGKEVTPAEVDKLSPELIHGINVLKDEAAVKMYGQRGRYGSISITTKTKAATGNKEVYDKVILDPE